MRIEDFTPVEILGAKLTEATLFAEVPWPFTDEGGCSACAFRGETFRFCQSVVTPAKKYKCIYEKSSAMIEYTQEALENYVAAVAAKRLGATNEN